MRLAAIFNVWADCIELLPYAIGNIFPVVDGIIVVWSFNSNHGHYSEACKNYAALYHHPKIHFYQLEPEPGEAPHKNETAKRNYGLDIVRKLGYTHFVMLDADEFYDRQEFETEKEIIEKYNIVGIVCRTKVYFKKPTLTIGYDHTLVPFIHKISPELRFGNYKDYPFAYDINGNAHIDPTRRMQGCGGGIHLSHKVTMHHYSWVRSDYNLKIENSAARNNLKKSSIYRDLENAKEGAYNEFYRATLIKCENYFNIPEL